MRVFPFFRTTHTLNAHFGNWSPVQFASHLVHNLHSRHIAKDLTTRDNHMLADIGINRREVEHAAHVNLVHDALEELEYVRSHDHEDLTVLSHDVDGLKHTNLRSKT